MVYKQVNPSDLVKGERYHFSIDGKFDRMHVVGIYYCSRIQWDGADFNQLFFYPIKGNTKKRCREKESWVTQLFKDWWIIDHTKIKIYLKVTRKDYKQKLREMFEQTALRTVLKKIVNEDFEWH